MIFENINYVMSNGIGRHELTHTGWLSQNWTNFFCIHLTSLSRFDLATLYTNFILHGSSKITWNCIKYLWNGCICWNIIQLKCITNKYDLSVIITYTLQKKCSNDPLFHFINYPNVSQYRKDIGTPTSQKEN